MIIGDDDIPSTMGEGFDNINNSDSMNITGEDDGASMSTETATPSLPLPAFKPRPPPPRRPSLLPLPPAAPPALTPVHAAPPVPASAEGIAVEKVPSASEEASVVAACPAATTPAPAPVATAPDASLVETTAATSPTPPPPPPAMTSPSTATYAHSHSRCSTGHSKSSAVSTLLGELIQHCGSTALQSSHLPYTVLHARLRHLCATFESVKSKFLYADINTYENSVINTHDIY